MHEFIHTPIPNEGISISKYNPLSRSYYKLIEIIKSNYFIDYNKKILLANKETLDELNLNKENISFIKIDVEEHELQVLDGGSNFFKEHSPIVAFEQHSHEFFQGESLVINKLKSLGYTSFYCIKTSPTYI